MARSLSPRSRSPRRNRFARPQLEVLEDRCLLSAGQLDPTFGLGGKVTTDIGGVTQDRTRDLVVSQPDGKAVLVGISGSVAGAQMVALRYNGDGSLDSGFGSGGKAVFRFTGSDTPVAAALDAAGRLVVAGTAYTGYPTGYDFAVTRLNP